MQEPETEYIQPRVSPYRLAAHLTSAFAIYSGLFWTALSVVSPYPTISGEAGKAAMRVRRLALPVAALVGITAVSGAFVAGNDAVSSLLLVSDAWTDTILCSSFRHRISQFRQFSGS